MRRHHAELMSCEELQEEEWQTVMSIFLQTVGQMMARDAPPSTINTMRQIL